MSDRPKVGPADPATRRRLLEEKMRENAKGDKTYQKPSTPAPAQPTRTRERRLSTGRTIDEEVSHMVRDDKDELSKKIRSIDREWTR